MGRGGRRWKPFLSVANSSITLCRPSIRNGNSAGLGVSTTMNRIENANFAASQRGKRISIRILEKVFIGIVTRTMFPSVECQFTPGKDIFIARFARTDSSPVSIFEALLYMILERKAYFYTLFIRTYHTLHISLYIF